MTSTRREELSQLWSRRWMTKVWALAPLEPQLSKTSEVDLVLDSFSAKR